MADEVDDDAAFWRGHVEAWHASGLSRSAYCRAYRLDGRSFHDWAGRVRGKVRRSRSGGTDRARVIGPEGGGFVPVLVADQGADPVGSAGATASVEIAVGGATIRVEGGVDGGLLRTVLTAVRATA